MTNSDLIKYVKIQLGGTSVDVELTNDDYNELIDMALAKLAPYYEGHRFIQASGKVIDLSKHHPLAIEKVYSVKENQITSLEEYAYGGTGMLIFDANLIDRIVSYKSFKMLYDELRYQKGQNYKLINNVLYLDGYDGEVLIDILVLPKVVSDVEETSMYYSWLKEYTLALAKETIGRIRGKFTVEGSPYTLDSAQLLQEAQQEKQNLESQLQGEIFVM